jgi:CDP-glycerol glycerophosphotransferase (TagB/SpsB family)
MGFPFIDALASSPLTREQYDARLHLTPDKPIVLFGPHHFALEMGGSADYLRDMLEALKPLDANLVLKLHATSFYPAMAGGNHWRPVLEKLARDPRVHIDEEEEDLSALYHADVLVNDYSSRAFIFMAMHKPVVLVTPSTPNLTQENLDRMKLMRSGSLLARSPSEAARLVSRVLSDPVLPPNAIKVAERCFSNLWNATDPVIEFITRVLSSVDHAPA